MSPAASPSTTIWDEILSPQRSQNSALLAWRLMRQFLPQEEIEREFGVAPRWHWNVEEKPLAECEQAVKLRLSSRAGVRCETVVLLPKGPRRRHNERRLLRATACVSSQPGCGVGCPFCATASLGYRGNLSAQEIVEQVYLCGLTANRLGRTLRNVVYMGMGEPLHNFQAVLDSLRILTSNTGFGLSPQRITVSTSGVPRAMRSLAAQFPRARLALSLHAAEPKLRRQLVPKAVCDMDVLRGMIAEVNTYQTHPVWLEVVLLDGINDSLDDALRLVEFCDGLEVEVNLIPYNSTANPSRFSAAPRARREAFARVLREAKIRTTMRTSFGSSSDAACGQLTAMPAEHHPSV